jgi:hypothetical protein
VGSILQGVGRASNLNLEALLTGSREASAPMVRLAQMRLSNPVVSVSRAALSSLVMVRSVFHQFAAAGNVAWQSVLACVSIYIYTSFSCVHRSQISVCRHIRAAATLHSNLGESCRNPGMCVSASGVWFRKRREVATTYIAHVS